MVAMADQIRSVLDDVTDIAIQVEPKMVLNPSPPTIDIFPGDTARDPETAAMGEIGGGYIFTVRARIHTADHEASQDILVAFGDDQDDLCVPAALLADATLGGLAADMEVLSETGFSLYPDTSGEAAYLGCQWSFLVLPAYS